MNILAENFKLLMKGILKIYRYLYNRILFAQRNHDYRVRFEGFFTKIDLV